MSIEETLEQIHWGIMHPRARQYQYELNPGIWLEQIGVHLDEVKNVGCRSFDDAIQFIMDI